MVNLIQFMYQRITEHILKALNVSMIDSNCYFPNLMVYIMISINNELHL